MISINFNSYASLAIFVIIRSFFFCFWTRNYAYYTSVRKWLRLLLHTAEKKLRQKHINEWLKRKQHEYECLSHHQVWQTDKSKLLSQTDSAGRTLWGISVTAKSRFVLNQLKSTLYDILMQRICRFKTNINREVFREIEAHFDKETVWEHNIITQDWSTYLLRRSSPTVPASVLWHLTGQRKGDSRGLLLAPVLTSMYVCQHDANSKQADTGNLHLSDESFSIYHHFSNNLLYNFDQSEMHSIAVNHAQ